MVVVIRDHNLRNHIEHVLSLFQGLRQNIFSNLMHRSLHDQLLAVWNAFLH